MTAATLGARSGVAVVIVGITYAVVLGVGMEHAGFSEPIGDPILALMEVLTIASALPLLLLFVAFHDCTAPSEQRWSLVARRVAALFALATIGVHVGELTAGRATGRHGLVWPSVPYTIELLAWDVLLGVALMLAAVALPRDHASQRLRRWLLATGALCVLGIVGPLVSNMRLQLIGVFGYAVMLPMAAWVWSRWFRSVAPPPPNRSRSDRP